MRRRRIKLILVAVAGITSLPVLALAVILTWPGLVLNPRTLAWGARQAARAGIIDLSWRSVVVKVQSPAWLRKKVALDFDRLCAHRAETGDARDFESACFRAAKIEFEADLGKMPPRFREISALVLSGGELTISSVPGPRKESVVPARAASRPALAPSTWLPAWLRDTRIGRIRIELDHWRVLQAGSEAARGRATLDRPARGWDAPSRGELDARAEFPGRETAELHGHANEGLEPGSFDYRLTSSWSAPGRGATLTAQGRISPDSVSGRMGGLARRVLPEIPRIRLAGCDFELRRTEAADLGGKLRFDCLTRLNARLPVLGAGKLKEGLKLPSDYEVALHADLDTPFVPGPDSEVRGTLTAKLKPVRTSLFEGQAALTLAIDGVPSEFPRSGALNGEVGANLRIPRFESLVERLEGGDWAVPAPLHVLKGEVALDIAGAINPVHGELPLRFTTRLRSSTQRLNLDAQGTFHFDRPPHHRIESDLGLELALTDVQLELPRLSLEAPPRLVPDERIHRLDAAPRAPAPPTQSAGRVAPESGTGSGSAFRYRIRVMTTAGHPVLLLSNLAKAPIPVTIDLKAGTGQSVLGTIHVSDFPVRLFKRDATLERFDLGLEDRRNPISGSIRVVYADYTLHIQLAGTTGKPVIHLVSDPPLPERQLFAVLLFGRPLDELDPDQASSAGRAQAAIADGAVSLASLYVLASTPIESIGYDPGTGIFSAKVRISEGTSLNVGAAPGSLQSIGISRRLSRRWRITTDFARPGGTLEDRKLSAFLEWTNRY